MTESKNNIEIVDSLRSLYPLQNFEEQAVMEVVAEFKALKEKAEPKKVKTRGQGHETDCFCPNCDAFLGDDQHWQFNQTKHCSKCGQNLEEY